MPTQSSFIDNITPVTWVLLEKNTTAQDDDLGGVQLENASDKLLFLGCLLLFLLLLLLARVFGLVFTCHFKHLLS